MDRQRRLAEEMEEELMAVERFVWTPELDWCSHVAVEICGGPPDAVPSYIVEAMGVRALTAPEVTTHIQGSQTRIRGKGRGSCGPSTLTRGSFQPSNRSALMRRQSQRREPLADVVLDKGEMLLAKPNMQIWLEEFYSGRVDKMLLQTRDIFIVSQWSVRDSLNCWKMVLLSGFHVLHFKQF